MYKLDIPADPKEEAALALRRKRLEERKRLIFDPKARKMGVDPEALKQQIEEKRAREQQERDFEQQADEEMVRQEKISLLLEQRHREDLKAVQMADAEYWGTEQTRDKRREWDLNDPEASRREQPLRTPEGGAAPNLGPSSLQVFDGEDDEYEQRMRTQREQQRDWAIQQLRERELIEAEERELDHIQELQMQQNAAHAQRAQTQAERDHADRLRQTAEENLRKLEEERQRRKEQQDEELRRDYEDIMHQVKVSLDAEKPEAAVGNGKRKILPDRFRGMTPAQLEAIRREQAEQALLNKEIREAERSHDEAHKRMEMQLSRQALLAERRLQREQADEQRSLREENARLAQEQKKEQTARDRDLARNAVQPTFFDQFNRDAR